MGSKKQNQNSITFINADDPEEINEFISILPNEEDDEVNSKNIPSILPILPLRNTVLFPHTVIPITVSREMSVVLINDAYKGDRKIGVVAQRSEDVENPGEDDIYMVGTIAHIIKKIKLPDENTMVIIQGVEKFEIKNLVQTEPYLKAEIKIIEADKPKVDKKFQGMIDAMKNISEQIIELSPNIPKEANIALKNLNAPSYLMNFIASNMNIEVQEKQKILELNNSRKKALLILDYLSKEIEMLKIKNEIQDKVKTDIDKQQRDFYLHQQLKTIHEELGLNTPEQEIENFVKRAEKKKWTKDAKEVFDKELHKLSRMNPAAAEYSVIANYIELLLDLPWQEYTKDNQDLNEAQRILDKDHYGLDKVKERILEYLAVIHLKGDMKSPILCLYGPPGVGKTSLGKSVARAMGRKYIRISLGGLHDEAEIRGHRKTYIGAMPGRIIQSIKKAKISNPVIVLDEIDKVGSDFKGDPASALLEVLDPEQNSNFYDNYLEMEYDLSHVMFIATANNLNTIHPALKDRLEIIELNGYLMDEKTHIAKDYLVPKQRVMHGLKAKNFKLPESSLHTIIDNYTRESGVRGVEKKIAKLCRWQAKAFISDKDFKPTLSVSKVQEILGPKIFDTDTYVGDDLPGVVTGLAWTPSGGDVLYIETSLSPGKGNILLTGKLGDVMKESAQLAFTYLKSNYKTYGIDPKSFEIWDLHIHVPEGAVPKEGPSAGITLFTSLVSLFTQRNTKKNIAMTGELTLRGVVLPVGGIKEKILAAKRKGISHIILCENNRKDVEDIQNKYVEGLIFHYVKQARDVIEIALDQKQIANPLQINNPDLLKK
ncbi:MAG: endopeptidase La [Bacteroidetes bacterium]|nr:endopeptidase La [Bacteroidota bacterium]